MTGDSSFACRVLSDLTVGAGTRGRENVAVSRRAWWPAAVGVVCVVAAVHAAVVAGHYVVGSFDDDGHYLALAKAFVDGKGYVDTSAPGSPTESLYPPGYPLLLTPLVAIARHVVWPLRLLSAAAFVGCIPLLDVLLRRRSIAPAARIAVLLLFALNPVGATFATEVMPESVFLLVLLLVLVALPRWEEQPRLLTWSGVAVAVGAPYLLLLKAAGLPMLAGVVVWLALRRRWRHAAAVAVCSAVMIAPVVIARLVAGPVVGTRYTSEYRLAGAVLPAIWHGAEHYVTDAIPATLVPTVGTKLLGHAAVLDALLNGLRYSAALFVVIGWVVWLRHRLDVSILVIPLYLAETLPFPYINERRVILLLPWVVAWYVAGWSTFLRALVRRRPVVATSWQPPLVAAVPAVAVVALLVWQLPRDYLLRLGETSPAARGSGYVAALREMTPPGWSIATGYRWTIADLTGRTATNTAHFTFRCPAPDQPGNAARLRSVLTRERVATVLDATLKWPGSIDDTCILHTMSSADWAVPVYAGSDLSTVFVLVGPATPRAGLAVAADRRMPAGPVVDLGAPVRVRELSVEVAGRSTAGRLELRVGGHWQGVPTTSSGGSPDLLHAQLSQPVVATAARVVGADGATLRDFVVLAEK